MAVNSQARARDDDPSGLYLHQQLESIARDSMGPLGSKSWDDAKADFCAKVMHDPDLLWELFAPYRDRAIQALLSGVAAEQRAEARRQNPVRLHDGSHISADRVAGGAQTARVDVSGMRAVGAVAALTLLDTFRINGRPIGDVTPTEANGWAASRERDARFVRMLTTNLPLGMPIRQFRTGVEAGKMYREAMLETLDV